MVEMHCENISALEEWERTVKYLMDWDGGDKLVFERDTTNLKGTLAAISTHPNTHHPLQRIFLHYITTIPVLFYSASPLSQTIPVHEIFYSALPLF
jgi:hypothetical protein